MPNNKIKGRKESTILRELAFILEKEMNNELLKTLSIAEVRLTNDSESAKIFWSFLPIQGITQELLEEELQDHLKEIRMRLAHKLNTRSVPELHFQYDTSLDNANKIEQILKEVNHRN